MAIQVSSTTVIDNSRNLNNIAGADATTVSNLQSAGLGASTTYGAVGTYVYAYRSSGRSIIENTTYAGSGLEPAAQAGGLSVISDDGTTNPQLTKGGSALSGTWRAMGRGNASYSGTSFYHTTLFVRIS